MVSVPDAGTNEGRGTAGDAVGEGRTAQDLVGGRVDQCRPWSTRGQPADQICDGADGHAPVLAERPRSRQARVAFALEHG